MSLQWREGSYNNVQRGIEDRIHYKGQVERAQRLSHRFTDKKGKRRVSHAVAPAPTESFSSRSHSHPPLTSDARETSLLLETSNEITTARASALMAKSDKPQLRVSGRNCLTLHYR